MALTPAALVRSFFATLVLFVSSTVAYSGEATAYASAGGRGNGACGIRKNIGKYETYFASMNERQYSSGKCGSCIKVTGRRGSIVAMIVDKCMGCKHGDVDLSTNGLKATTGYEWDRKPVTWSYTSCGSTSDSNKKKKKKSKKKNGRKLFADVN